MTPSCKLVPIQTLLANVRDGGCLRRIDDLRSSSASHLSLTHALDVAGNSVDLNRHISAIKTRACDSHSLPSFGVACIMTYGVHSRHNLGFEACGAVVGARFHLIHGIAGATEECGHV